MKILYLDDAICKSPWFWHWPALGVTYFNGSCETKKTNYSPAYNDSTLELNGKVILRIPKWPLPQEVWSIIGLALIEHDIICEALNITMDVLELPDME